MLLLLLLLVLVLVVLAATILLRVRMQDTADPEGAPPTTLGTCVKLSRSSENTD